MVDMVFFITFRKIDFDVDFGFDVEFDFDVDFSFDGDIDFDVYTGTTRTCTAGTTCTCTGACTTCACVYFFELIETSSNSVRAAMAMTNR